MFVPCKPADPHLTVAGVRLCKPALSRLRRLDPPSDAPRRLAPQALLAARPSSRSSPSCSLSPRPRFSAAALNSRGGVLLGWGFSVETLIVTWVQRRRKRRGLFWISHSKRGGLLTERRRNIMSSGSKWPICARHSNRARSVPAPWPRRSVRRPFTAPDLRIGSDLRRLGGRHEQPWQWRDAVGVKAFGPSPGWTGPAIFGRGRRSVRPPYAGTYRYPLRPRDAAGPHC